MPARRQGRTSSSSAFRFPIRRRRPVIQAANMRALAGGVTTDKIFAMVERIRKKTEIPLVFMTYANVVFSYGKGTEDFVRRAAEVGINGLILPDVPFEEKEEFDSPCRKYGLDFISLIAPTSHDRIQMIAKEARGFVYCVSSLGVTGTRSEITTDIGAMVKLVKDVSDISCAVGFGISTPEQAARMAALSDGAIVGSAIVKLCGLQGGLRPEDPGVRKGDEGRGAGSVTNIRGWMGYLPSVLTEF